MKKRTGIIASSVASIALCAALVAGSTFALFTSESEVNIAVTTGKVNAVATVTGVVTYSNGVEQSVVEGEEETKYMFENGGYVTVSGSSVALNQISPMDKVEITVGIENKSDIDVLYRTYFMVSEDSGLAEALVCEIDGKAYNGEVSWHEFAAENEVTFSMELPEETGNEYQEKSCKIACIVEAIQKNAVKNTTAKTFKVDGKLATLQAAFDAAVPGDTVELVDDVTTTSTSYFAKAANNDLPIIIEGNGHTIYGSTTDTYGGSILSFDHTAVIRNLNMECVTGLENGSGIWLSAQDNELTNVRIEGVFNMAAVNLSNANVSATLNNCYLRSYKRTEAVNGNLTFNIVYGGKVYTEYAYNQICGLPYLGLFVSASNKSPRTIINNCDIDTVAINGPVSPTNERLLVDKNNKIGTIYDCTKDGLGKTLLINEEGQNQIGETKFCPDKSGDFSTDAMFEDGTICEVTEEPTLEGYVFAGWYCYKNGNVYNTYAELMEAVSAKTLKNGTTLICLWEKA